MLQESPLAQNITKIKCKLVCYIHKRLVYNQHLCISTLKSNIKENHYFNMMIQNKKLCSGRKCPMKIRSAIPSFIVEKSLQAQQLANCILHCYKTKMRKTIH